MDFSKLEINAEFKKALKLMEDSATNLFITGKAGTGKSTLLQYFLSKTKKKNVAVLAPTGVAAINVGGQTIHSFFGFKPDITADKVKNDYKNKTKKGLYKKLDAIVIDEISMVRADLLDCVDEFLRLNGKSKKFPFGGIKMIFIGDLYQLPPVVTKDEKGIFQTHYESPYFFSAKVIKSVKLELMQLNKIYRQSEKLFIDILNSIRNKSIDDTLLEALNQNLNPDFEFPKNDFYIYLTTTNAKARQVNLQNLDKLKGKLYEYEGEISGNFEQNAMPTDLFIQLKNGSQIMLVNNDRDGRWVNGTVGKVVDIEKDDGEDDIVWVKLANGNAVDVYPYTWEMFKFKFENGRLESDTVGTFRQYPIILAWAITIHKSQGKTFDKVILDMDRGAFAHGQTYVALSRCTSLRGLVLKKPIKKSHIWMDWQVVKFLTRFQYQKSGEVFSLDDKINILNEAVKSNGKLEIVYLKSNDTKSKRVISPEVVDQMEYMGVDFLGVEAFDESRNDTRIFRVDRILEMRNI